MKDTMIHCENSGWEFWIEEIKRIAAIVALSVGAYCIYVWVR